MNASRDQAAVVGMGRTTFAKHLARSELDLAIEAILAARGDAGISTHVIASPVLSAAEDFARLRTAWYDPGTPLGRRRAREVRRARGKSTLILEPRHLLGSPWHP